MMRLYLVRHAEAEAEAADDSLRNLTESGWAQAQAVADWLCGQVVHPARVLASPYLRAQQTALVIQESLHLPAVISDELIVPEGDIVRAEQLISGRLREHDEELIVVSHMPLIASLCNWLQEGVMGIGESFALAEVRVLEAEVMAPGLGRVCTTYLPTSGDRPAVEWRSLIPKI